MEQQMFLDRAASYFGRIHVPDVLMGSSNVDEFADVAGTPRDVTGVAATAAD
jgi:hypothetical protein